MTAETDCDRWHRIGVALVHEHGGAELWWARTEYERLGRRAEELCATPANNARTAKVLYDEERGVFESYTQNAGISTTASYMSARAAARMEWCSVTVYAARKDGEERHGVTEVWAE